MARLNHAKLSHRGRPTEPAFAPRPKWNPNSKAVAASPARSLPAEMIAAIAAERGYAVAAR